MRTLWKPLLFGLLLATSVAGALSTWVSWRAARIEVDELLDAELAQSVRGLAVLAQGLLQDEADPAARDGAAGCGRHRRARPRV